MDTNKRVVIGNALIVIGVVGCAASLFAAFADYYAEYREKEFWRKARQQCYRTPAEEAL